MKKNLFYLLSTIAFLSSCKKNDIVESGKSQSKNKATANMQAFALPIPSIDFDWENTDVINIKGQNIVLPWVGGASTTIPTRVLNEMSKANGWELYYNFPSWINSAQNQNYLIFHNKFTGVLRVFSYNTVFTTNNSSGLFNVQIEGPKPTALLSLKDPLIGEFSSLNPNSIHSNSSDGQYSGFRVGWNCIDVPLSYDPNITSSDKLKLSISTDQQQLSNINLTGSFSSETKGELVTTSSSNPLSGLVNSISKAGGDEAKKLIEKKIQSNKIKNKSEFLSKITSGASDLISEFATSGISGIFSSFIGGFGSSTPSSQSITLSTEGKINMNGTILSGIPGVITSFKSVSLPGSNYEDGGFLPSKNDPFGSWTLKQRPIVTFTKFARGYKDDVTQSYSIDNSSIEILMNPKTSEAISNYTVTTELWYYNRYMGVNRPKLGTGPSNVGGPQIYGVKKAGGSGGNYGELIYQDNENEFYRKLHAVYVANDDWIESRDPSRKNIPMENYDSSFVVKVTVTLYPKAPYNTSPIVMTRSYSPIFQ